MQTYQLTSITNKEAGLRWWSQILRAAGWFLNSSFRLVFIPRCHGCMLVMIQERE